MARILGFFNLSEPKFWYSKSLVAYALLPLSLIYLFASLLRKIFARRIRFPAPVICVGNLNLGGTGKTQVVTVLAKFFKEKKRNFVIISKGYGSLIKEPKIVTKKDDSKSVGDESILLSKYGTVIAARRTASCLALLKDLKPSVIITDDGFQNPSFYKDFSILTIDPSRKFGNGFLFPAGPLREIPSAAFKKADLIIALGKKEGDYLRESPLPILESFVRAKGEYDKKLKYYAFCAIGAPERFLNSLANYGLKIVGSKFFPDHYEYSEKDLDTLRREAKTLDAKLITTSKDYVKAGRKLEVTNFEVELFIPEFAILEKLLYEKVFKKNPSPS